MSNNEKDWDSPVSEAELNRSWEAELKKRRSYEAKLEKMSSWDRFVHDIVCVLFHYWFFRFSISLLILIKSKPLALGLTLTFSKQPKIPGKILEFEKSQEDGFKTNYIKKY